MDAFFRDAVLPVLTPMAIDRDRAVPDAGLAEPESRASCSPRRPARKTPGSRSSRSRPGWRGWFLPPAPAGARSCCSRTSSASSCRCSFPGRRSARPRVIRLARDAELELDDEGGGTHLEAVEREVRRRRRGDVVRLEIEADASPELIERLTRQLELDGGDVYLIPGPLDLRVLFALTELPGFDELREPPLQPADVLLEPDYQDLFAVLDAHDVLLHHPYDSYDPVLALLDAGSRGSGRAGDQADALSHQRRLTADREPAGSGERARSR